MKNTKLVSLESVMEIIENAIPYYGEHRLVKLDVIKNIQQLPTQEAIEEYKNGLLKEVGKTLEGYEGYPESLIAGIEIAYRKIKSYNLPIK